MAEMASHVPYENIYHHMCSSAFLFDLLERLRENERKQLKLMLSTDEAKKLEGDKYTYDEMATTTSKAPEDIVKTIWGLLPHWAPNRKFGRFCYNARAETIREKPSYRDAFKDNQRCVIWLSGHYEWDDVEGSKYKLRKQVQFQDKRLIPYAGLWSKWVEPETGEIITTSTIITTEATGLISQVNDRSPVILHDRHIEDWLTRKALPNSLLKEIFSPYPDDELEMFDAPVIVKPKKKKYPPA